MTIRCRSCRHDETPSWFVSCIAYAHTAGELAHYCSSGRRITVGVDELEGAERAEAERMVGASASASKANAAAYRARLDEEPRD
jgi:hypothetical protein